MEFVECPALARKVALDGVCRLCPHHVGVTLAMHVEHVDPQSGGVISSQRRLIYDRDEPALRQTMPAAVITQMERYLHCGFPRYLGIESVVEHATIER